MRLRLELFAEDIARSIDFYTRVLGFAVLRQDASGYTALANGETHLGINRRVGLPADYPVQTAAGERVGKGVEIVLAVDDVGAERDRVRATGWPFSSDLAPRPWGASDFRLVDPDGYYLRITSGP